MSSGKVIGHPLLEELETNSTDKNAIYAPDGTGGVEIKINPTGIFFDGDLTLTGDELANRFIFIGDTSATLTLPLESAITSDYIIIVENKSSKIGRVVTIAAQGADTLTGPSVAAVGDNITVERSGVGEFTSQLLASTNRIKNQSNVPGSNLTGALNILFTEGFGTDLKTDDTPGPATTTSTVLADVVTFNVPALLGGIYRIGWSYEIANGTANRETESEIEIDGTPVSNDIAKTTLANKTCLRSGFIHNQVFALGDTPVIKLRLASAAPGTAIGTRVRFELYRTI